MKDYLLHYDEIEKQWEQCAAEIDSRIREVLNVPYIQRAGKTVSLSYPSAIASMNYRFVEITPKIIKGEKIECDWSWYKDSDAVQKVSDAIKSTVEQNGFQYEGVEAEKDNAPLFIVKLGV